MNKKHGLVGIVLFALLFSSIQLSSCQPTTGDHCSTDFRGETSHKPYVNPNPLKVLIAIDEEASASVQDWFGEDVSAETYAVWQTWRAWYRFPWEMVFVDVISWKSADWANLKVGVVLLEEKVGWKRHYIHNGHWVDLLVGWTGQDNDPWDGCANVGHAICLNEVHDDWRDDNTVQEELTHLFGYEEYFEHCNDGDCVMSRAEKYYGWTDESLVPVEERTVTINLYSNQMVGDVSPEWCERHYEILLASGGVPDKSWESEILTDPEILNEPKERLGALMGEPPNDDEDNIHVDPEGYPTNPWVPQALIGIAIIVAVIIAVYIYKRRLRKKEGVWGNFATPLLSFHFGLRNTYYLRFL